MTKNVLWLLTAAPGAGVALTAPDRPDLSYDALRAVVAGVRRQLAARDIGPGDRVAIVLPNGPEMAVAFLAVAAGASTAPLNPGYKLTEYPFYLADLAPKLVLVAPGSVSPARQAADDLGIAVAELQVVPDAPAGAFTLWTDEADAVDPAPAQEALVLHTSGTTSRPKVVPLSQANLFASARNIADTLGLSPQDHCLNVMPLFAHPRADRGGAFACTVVEACGMTKATPVIDRVAALSRLQGQVLHLYPRRRRRGRITPDRRHLHYPTPVAVFATGYPH